ncbi:hypothetical protein [Arthrobacter sp. TMN-50]
MKKKIQARWILVGMVSLTSIVGGIFLLAGNTEAAMNSAIAGMALFVIAVVELILRGLRNPVADNHHAKTEGP